MLDVLAGAVDGKALKRAVGWEEGSEMAEIEARMRTGIGNKK